jgi:hypothetical protein
MSMTYKEARNSPPLERLMDKVWKTENCWIWLAACNEEGYGLFSVKRPGKQRRSNQGAHRWLYEHLYGTLAPGLHVLHMCENPICVNPAHLKPGTRSQNHQMGRPPHGKSKYRGVSFQKTRGMWRAQITKDRKKENLGDFAIEDEEEAALAYDAKAIEFFEYPKLNFPNGRTLTASPTP